MACQVSPFAVYNLLVTCQLNLSAKVSSLCDWEVKCEDALRTFLAVSCQHANRNMSVALCFQDEILRDMLS